MSTLTKEQLEAFAHLKGSSVGQMLLKILRTRAREIDAANRTAEGAAMHRGQGRAIALDDLADEIEKSSEQIRRLQSPQKTQS